MRRASALLALFTLAAGCGDDPDPPLDGGSGRADGGVATQCERRDDCDDGLFCTTEDCQPGATGADRFGCVRSSTTCGGGEECIEAEAACVARDCSNADADGDGRDAMVCGGDDCDDFDPNRYPGNAEVCDVDGHDEDCDAETVGGTDTDMDGFVSAACCNGGRCGDDCADDAAGISPTGSELCNGRDDDCDGTVDEEETEALCPGGVCTAGRCDLAGWDRTYGGIGNLEIVSGVSMDERGTIYVLGSITGDASFSGEVVSAPDSDVFLAAYEADGRIRWARTYPSAGFDRPVALDFDDTASQLYFLANINQDRVAAGPARSAELVAVDLDGEVLWRRTVSGRNTQGRTLSANDGVSVGGILSDTDTVAGAELALVGQRDTYVVSYSSAGAHQWTRPINGGAGAFLSVVKAERSASGETYVLGAARGPGIDFGDGLIPNTAGNDNLFVVALGATGTARWEYFHDDAAPSEGTALTIAGDELVVAGTFGGDSATFAGSPLAFVGSATNAVLLTLAVSDGTEGRVRGWAWNDDRGAVLSLASTSAGELIAGGLFTAEVDFGGGRRPAPSSSAAFYVVLDDRLRLRAERVFTYPGWPAADCPAFFCDAAVFDIAVGPADSTALVGTFANSIDLGSGPRVSVGEADGFLLRLPN